MAIPDRGENAEGDDLAFDLGEPDLDWLSHAE